MMMWLSGLVMLLLVLVVVLISLKPRNIRTFVNSVDNTCVFDEAKTPCSSGNRIVMYYAPWCNYCTALQPEFDKAASQAASAGLDVCFVTVNSDAQGQGSSCFKSKGATALPTIQLEGVDSTFPYKVYNGLRASADIFSWVQASLPKV